MSKYAVMVVLDLDVGVPVGASEHDLFDVIERVTKKRVQSALENEADGIKVKMIRAKFLGMAENG